VVIRVQFAHQIETQIRNANWFRQKGEMMRSIRLVGLLGLLSLAACTSVGSLGVITKSSSDPVSVLGKSHSVKDLGPAEGQACRYFALAVIPWGDSDIQTAVDRALQTSGGDALVNVATSTSLYGFVPIYNVFSFTCTTVKGTAVKLE
jgi:hypothetical protein